MKGKICLFKSLLPLTSLIFVSSIYSTDQFPIGVYNPPPDSLYGQVDSCGFNIIVGWARKAQLDSAYNWGLKVINRKSWHAQGNGTTIRWPVSAQWKNYEAEDEDLFSHETGSEIYDPSASGDWAFKATAGIDSPGYLLYDLGRPIDQRYRNYQNNHFYITFRMKVDDNTGTDTVAKISASRYEFGSGYVEAESVLMAGDFENPDTYLDFILEFGSDEEEADSMDYRVYWYGYRTLWVDYVLAQDSNAVHLFAGEWDDSITNYIEEYQGFPALFRWYLCDEPNMDQYRAQRYVDSLIRTVNPEHPGITALCYAWGDCELFVNQINPNELLFDHYPISTAVPIPGNSEYNDSLQVRFDELTMWVRKHKEAADMGGIPFWFITQVHSWHRGSKDPDPDLREPTPEEIRAMVNLALAYGAQGIFYYRYTSTEAWGCTGLVNTDYVPTVKWYEVQRINSDLTSLGPTFLDLTWIDAFPSDSISSHPSYITGISSAEFPPGEEYIEIGIFRDDFLSDYFMLVNRRCDTTDTQTVTVQTNKTDGQWMIEDVLTGEKYATSDGCFRKISLGPGDGRLFKLRQLFVGDENWSGVVHISSSIDVPSERTLTLEPGSILKFARSTRLYGGGYIQAEGAESSLITFTADTTNPTEGYWQGIEVYHTGNHRFSYCDVSYGDYGIKVEQQFGPKDSLATVIIQHCHIHHNQSYGIYCRSSSKIMGNLIEWNDVGIFCEGEWSKPKIRGNTIKACTRGILCTNSANPDLGRFGIGDPGNNQIEMNLPWNLYNETSNTIMAEGNWWGTDTEGEIDDFIYGPVDFDPWLRDFIRGDANADMEVSMADATYILAWKFFPGAPPPPCMDAADADDSGTVGAPDANYILRYCFIPGSPPPPPPFPDCGLDLTSDTLGCASHPCPYGPVASGEEEFGGTFSLGKFVLTEEELIVPVYLTSVETLSAFAWKVEYDPNLITSRVVNNKGLITEEFDFFSARSDDEEGWIRTGALVSFTLEQSLPPGDYRVANMVFKLNADCTNLCEPVELTDAELVYLDKSYRAEIKNPGGSGGAMSAGSSIFSPRVFMLYQNQPNPFSHKTGISYSIPKRAWISLKIYDTSGRLVKTLVDGRNDPGYHTVHWWGENDYGTRVPSGVYFYRIITQSIDETQSHKGTKKMLLLR